MTPTQIERCEEDATDDDDRGPVTDPRLRVRVDEVMRHARRTFRHSVDVFDLDSSLTGTAPWTLSPTPAERTRPLWAPWSWFSALAVAGAVPLVIVYWMLH